MFLIVKSENTSCLPENYYLNVLYLPYKSLNTYVNICILQLLNNNNMILLA